MDNRILGQAITKAKQELKTVRQIVNDKSSTTNRQRQIVNDKSSTTNRQRQIVNDKSSTTNRRHDYDYDQLLNSIVHEQVDVNRRILLSTANDVSRCCDSKLHAHHNRTADRPRFPSNKPPALDSKMTTTSP